MTPPPTPGLAAIAIDGLVKDYRGLRPLRIVSLRVEQAERVALSGLDAAAAEVLVNLVNGAGSPDQGVVSVYGRSTADIPDADAWLASLEQFGIVTTRAVLLDGLSVRQNLAIPFTLAIDDLADDVRARVDALAAEVGIAGEVLDTPVAQAGPDVRLRVHLAKSIALAPRLLLLEHPTLGLDPAHVAAIAADVVRLCRDRALTALVISNDQAFTQAVATRALTLQPATGLLVEPRWWRRWFGF
jgi:ABC-type transporter Mla maintaining outer membrane lipid asymmetry ATPase subunit MlaF